MIKKEQIKTMGKAELQQLLYGIGRDEIRRVMNKVIAECRRIPSEEAKKKKLLLSHEVKKVIDYFGVEIEG